MIKHYMRLASERLCRFTAQDGVHESLIGRLKFEVIAALYLSGKSPVTSLYLSIPLLAHYS